MKPILDGILYGFAIIGALFCVVILLGILTGCVSGPPSCADNPRNMQCMSADQIRKELAQ